MRIIVCINDSLNDENTNESPTILNTDNENALEAALAIKDNDPQVTVIAVSVGPSDYEELLREAIAKGADEAVLVSDVSFDYNDPWLVADVMAKGLSCFDPADLIIAGKQEFDLGMIQIMPQIADKLGMPLISQVNALEMKDNLINVKSELEDISLKLEADLPCVISVTKEINTPRYTKIQDMIESLSADITILDAEDIGKAGEGDIGVKPVATLLSFPLKPRGDGIIIEGDNAEDIANNLMNHLRKRTVL